MWSGVWLHSSKGNDSMACLSTCFYECVRLSVCVRVCVCDSLKTLKGCMAASEPQTAEWRKEWEGRRETDQDRKQNAVKEGWAGKESVGARRGYRERYDPEAMKGRDVKKVWDRDAKQLHAFLALTPLLTLTLTFNSLLSSPSRSVLSSATHKVKDTFKLRTRHGVFCICTVSFEETESFYFTHNIILHVN